MKIPFLNRKRYIVLKCYSWHAGVVEKAPIFIGDGEKVENPKPNKFMEQQNFFSTCWSRINTRKRCATIPTPCSTRFEIDGDGVQWVNSNKESVLDVSFGHDADHTYGIDKDTIVAKVNLPWHIEDDSGVSFIVARHMQNKTMINVLSGVINFNYTAQTNMFALINKYPHKFEIPFKTPLMALYPMSDLPLHVECEHNPEKFTELGQKRYHPYFRACWVKLGKDMA
jgi:hypothetical protein